MIEIISEFEGDHANDINDFMRSLVVEVVSENYRQALFEDLLLKEKRSDQPLDLALRANERVVSGLFAFALGKVCGFARPEVKTSNEDSYGHVDYLAWYNNRVIAIELKAGHILPWSKTPRRDTVKKWVKATVQANEAQTYLRKVAVSDRRLQKPISIALMIVAGMSNKLPKDDAIIDKEEPYKNFKKALRCFKPKPRFSAIYSVPIELQKPARLKLGALAAEGQKTYIPCYGFLARERVHKK